LVLVAAHPGNPGQSPEGRKTDVCVCVCACVRACVRVFVTVDISNNDGYSDGCIARPVSVICKPIIELCSIFCCMTAV